MDSNKVGALLYRLRKEQGLTQKQLADRMNLSDKTISKWERGLGLPDVSLLSQLSDVFEVNIEKILSGDLSSNSTEMGNLKKIKFYVCPSCANVISNTGDAEISCCGRKLSPLVPRKADHQHAAIIEDSEGEYYITIDHEMSKSHYISFLAYVISDKIMFVKLYPEQMASVRLPKINGARLQNKYGALLYYYCSLHGLQML